MPQHRLITRPRKLTLHMPEEVMTRVDLYLISPTLGRIPLGAYSKFFTERFEEFFSKLKPAEQAEIKELNSELEDKVRAEAASKHFGQPE